MTIRRIARVVMRSKASMGSKGKKGGAFKEHLRSSFSGGLPDYHARLARIFTECDSLDAGLSLLPACAILHDSERHLRNIRDSASRLRWVAVGCLRLSDLAEFSQVWRFGEQLHEFKEHQPYSARLDGHEVVLAQSSTIRKVYRDPRRAAYRLALDLGHGQYSGRYKKTLIKLSSFGAMQVILAYWKEPQGTFGYGWFEGRGLSLARSVDLPSGDRIDIINLGDRGTNAG